jgi:hypothetical protein
LLAVKSHERGEAGLPRLRDDVVDWIARNPPAPSALRAVVMEFPQTFTWAGTIWQNRARLGLASNELRELIDDLLDTPSVRHFERHVGQEICIHNIVKALGHASELDLAGAYARTLLGNRAWENTSDTVLYFICHDIFFLSDWGERPIRDSIEPLDQWIGKLRGWYAHLAGAGNIDLAAELFMALSYLEETPDLSLLERSAAPSLDTLGLPQMPKGQGLGFIRPGDDERLQDFFRHYHTVIVCLIALLTNGSGNRPAPGNST